MPPARPSARVNVSEEGRRRRQATACTTCRSRQVKCDRKHPRRPQCQKGDRSCEYISPSARGIVFVPELQSLDVDTDGQPPLSSETWKSVIGQQIALVNRKELGSFLPGWLPFWKFAEDSDSSASNNSSLRWARNFLEGRDNGSELALLRQSASTSDIASLGEAFTTSLCKKLPPPDICTLFFEDYVNNIHPIVPICHIPTLKEMYSGFWLNLSSHTPIELLVLILAVLYTGGASSESLRYGENVQSLLELYDELIRVFDISAYYFTQCPSSVQLLQGYVIMSTFQASKFAPFAAFGFLPFAIRSAQSLRLHTNVRVEDPTELEIRHRLWWHLVYLDMESTIATGLQAVIHPSSYDISLPSTVPPCITPFDTTLPMAVAMQGHWELAHRMHIWFEKMPERHEIIHFSRIIGQLQDLVGKGEETEWARNYLELQVDRAYCMLGLRFWQLGQFKRTSCHSEVMKTARSFLHTFLRLSGLKRGANLSWFVPGVVQPIHALMILLLHLSTCEKRDEESHLSRELIDQIFGLRRNHILAGNILPLSAHMGNLRARPHSNSRYSALFMLRARVWQQFRWPIPGSQVPPGPAAFSEIRSVGLGIPTQAPAEPDLQLDLGADDMSIFDAWSDFSAGPPLDTEDNGWEDWLSLSANLAADTSM